MLFFKSLTNSFFCGNKIGNAVLFQTLVLSNFIYFICAFTNFSTLFYLVFDGGFNTKYAKSNQLFFYALSTANEYLTKGFFFFCY